jgi:hypothetical protein
LTYLFNNSFESSASSHFSTKPMQPSPFVQKQSVSRSDLLRHGTQTIPVPEAFQVAVEDFVDVFYGAMRTKSLQLDLSYEQLGKVEQKFKAPQMTPIL